MKRQSKGSSNDSTQTASLPADSQAYTELAFRMKAERQRRLARQSFTRKIQALDRLYAERRVRVVLDVR